MSIPALSTRPWQSALIVCVLGAIGALLNQLLLAPIPSPALYLGGLFYPPVLLRFGLGYALLCATLTQLPLLASQYWWLPLPELICLNGLMQRFQLKPMPAAYGYWLTIGLATSALLAFRIAGWDTTTRLLAVITPVLSGLVQMALTHHAVRVFKHTPTPSTPSLADQVANLLVIFVCSPVLVIHVIATPLYTREQLNDTLDTLEEAEHIAQERFSLLVERNLRGLQTVSAVVAGNIDAPLSTHEPLINRVIDNLQEVFTILLIDAQGYARAGAPDSYPDGIRVAESNQFYGDREYFLEARQNRQPAVSYGIVGRRMNREPVLSLVAPIVDNQHQFRGLVLGNLPVQRLRPVFDHLDETKHLRGLIHDRKQQILYSTVDWKLAPLASLEQLPFFAQIPAQPTPTELRFSDNLRPYLWQHQLIRHVASSHGGILLVQDLSPISRTMAFTRLQTLLLMIAIIWLARLLAARFSHQQLTPLLTLHRYLQEIDPDKMHQLQPLLIETRTREVAELARSVNGMIIRIAKSRLEAERAIAEKDQLNAELDRRIAERTAELASKAEQLEKLSITDGLTGLYNRRHLTTELRNEWQRSQRNGSTFAVVLFDVDHFKRINDQYGHPVGDEVLREIGNCLQHNLRGIDLPVRYGGEEFAILLPGLDAKHAWNLAERLREQIAERVLVTDQGSVQFTVSLGICDNLATTVHKEDDLLQRADQALYQAKRAGRNRSVIWIVEAPTA